MKTVLVQSIENIGVRPVFDLEVLGAHSYFSDGALVHNCSYHDLLDFYGKKYDDEFYKVKDTFITYKHRRLLLYPAGPNKKTLRGRCLVGETIVNTNLGFMLASELISEEGHNPVTGFKIDTHNGNQDVSHTFKDTSSVVVSVETHNGFTLCGTPEHPIYTKQNIGGHAWKNLEDVQIGDAFLSVGNNESPMWGSEDADVSYYAENAELLTSYPLEVRLSTKAANKHFISSLLRKGEATNNGFILMLDLEFVKQLQVILLHGFNILTTRIKNTLTIPYAQIKNLHDEEFEKEYAAYFSGVAPESNKYHHEVVTSKIMHSTPTLVYDFSVPNGRAFLANGIVSHNTRFFCLATDTLISTTRGLVPISKIKPGDTVYKGKDKRKVLSTTFSGRQSFSNVTLANGLQINCTPDHRFLVIEDDTLQEKWIEAKDITSNHTLLIGLGGEVETGGYKKDGISFTRGNARELAADYLNGTKNSKWYSRELPEALLLSSKDVVCAFLETLFLRYHCQLPIHLVQGVRSLLLRLSIIGYSNHSEIVLTPYEYSKLHNSNQEFTTRDIAAYTIPYSNHAFRKVYIFSELNAMQGVYEVEASRRSDKIDRNIAYCRVQSYYENHDEVDTYDICVDAADHTFTANGFTTHNSAIDEIGWFDNQNDGKVKMDATQVYVALDRSLLTVRGAATRLMSQGFDNITHGYAFNVSSPSSARDKIVELVSQSKTSKKIFGFKRATWEMNPNITKDLLSEEYAKNPVDAERDYACNPPLSDNAFIPSFASIETCFVGKPNKVRYKFAQHKGRDGSVTRFAKIDEVAKSTKANVMAIDAGYSGNSFAAVVAHQHEGTPIINSLIEVMPNPGMPLNHALIFREALHQIIRERNVKVLLADRWQSIKLLQDAEIEFDDLVADMYSLKYNDFWVLKQTLFDGELIFPKLPRPIDEVLKYDQSKYPYCLNNPIEHLAVQCITVRDMGNTIAKGDGLTDDLFRASALAAWAFTTEKYADILNGEGEEESFAYKGALGFMAGRSGAGAASQNEVHLSEGKAIGMMRSKR